MRPRGGPVAVLVALVAGAALLGAGCGEDEGVVAAGATVRAYVGAPLCAGARAELGRAAGAAGEVRLRAVCLPRVESGGGVELARVGANARRASEDSAAVAFLEAPGPAARFAEPIVEAAGIAWVETPDGAAAMRRVIAALDDAGGGSLRSAVRARLE